MCINQLIFTGNERVPNIKFSTIRNDIGTLAADIDQPQNQDKRKQVDSERELTLKRRPMAQSEQLSAACTLLPVKIT